MGSVSNILNVGSAGVSAAGAYTASTSRKYAGKIQASSDRTNALIAENQATDSITRGNQDAIRRRMDTSQLKSRQKTILAANGVDLSEGTAVSILEDTDLMGGFDESTIIANAQREAFGYRAQAGNYRSSANLMEARARAENPSLSAGVSLLTSGAQVAAGWYRSKGK